MNGREIEHLLTLIDENMLRGRDSLRGEILAYLRDHEHEALEVLRTQRKVSIPTQSGVIELDLADLEALVA